MSWTARFKSAERRGLTTILPWLVEFTQGTATRLRGPALEAMDAAKFDRAASAWRHQWEDNSSSARLSRGTTRARQ